MRAQDWFATYLRTFKWGLISAAGLGAISFASATALMFTSGYLISSAALRPESILLLYVPIVAVRTFGIARAVLRYLERLLGHNIALRILSAMRSRLYKVIEPHALVFHSRYKLGDALGIMADDIERLQDLYLRTVIPCITGLFIYTGVLIISGTYSVSLAVITGIYMSILMFAIPLISVFAMRSNYKATKETQQWMYRDLTDAILGLGDLMSSGREMKYLESFAAVAEHRGHVERRLHRFAIWRDFIVQVVILLAVLTTMVWTGENHQHGHLQAVEIAAFVLGITSIMDAFMPILQGVETVPSHRESLRRLSQTERDWFDNVTVLESEHDDDSFLEPKHVHVEVDHVSYRYPDTMHDALDDVSLTIPQGKKIAIIGRSGAGKSTLTKLLQGAISPTEGEVRINGQSAHHFGNDLTAFISVLNQSPHLFDTTVLNNIRIGKPGASLDEVHHAARLAQIEDLILSLPKGYDTPVSEAGQRFSGGERTRLALARVLLRNTPLLILDEPTVGLDPLTERRLLSTIFSATSGKSLVWITHHLVGIEKMDEIIFLDEGHIIERGSHQELIERSARYRRLYTLDMPFSQESHFPY